MKFLRIIIAISILLAQLSTLTIVHAQPQPPPETVEDVIKEGAEGIVDKTIFNNIAALAGPSCSMYALGLDIVNFFYDGGWSFQDSILEITVLFKNNPWRELSWAINDQREIFAKELTALKKQQCVLGFGLPEQDVKDPKVAENIRSQIRTIDRQVAQLEAKNDYFGIQRRNIISDRPEFPDPASFDLRNFAFRTKLQTDKIFYPLLSSDNFKINGEQFARDTKEFLKTAGEDLTVVAEGLSDTCFAVVNIGHELALYFAYAFHLEAGRFRDSEGHEYASFREFVNSNASAIRTSYDDAYCKKSTAQNLSRQRSQTNADVQFENFKSALGSIVKQVGTALAEVQKQLTAFDQSHPVGTVLTSDEEVQLRALESQSGTYQGMIDYYTLVLNKVGSSESRSLADLQKRLNSLVEAILGVTRDRDGKTSSRIAFSERFQKRKEKMLQDICGRIEAMYRDSGRDTAQLPEIGVANGTVYCRAKPECADVNLSNIAGGSEGLKKLAECSGFLFSGSELGPSQTTRDIISREGEDIGLLLEQDAYNDLLKAQKLHDTSLRSRYEELYKAQGAVNGTLENMLADVSKNLYNPIGNPLFNPNDTDSKTQYSVLRKIYQDFWRFMDQQEGSCIAPQHPE